MKNIITKVTTWFDNLPDWFQIIVYVMLAYYVTLLISEIQAVIDAGVDKWALGVLVAVINVLSYYLVKLQSQK